MRLARRKGGSARASRGRTLPGECASSPLEGRHSSRLRGACVRLPCISGWVLAASTVFPESGDVRHSDRCTPWLLRVGGDFPEVQFFCTHRVVEYHAWAKIVAGKVIRKYAYIGEQGLTVWNDGPPTAEELSLDLNFSKSSDVANLRFPDEEAVMQLAGAWSLNPSVIESYDFASGMGLLGSMPVEDTTIRSPQVSWLQRFRRLLPCGK